MHNSEFFFPHFQGSFVLIRKKKKIRPRVSQAYSWHHTFTDLDITIVQKFLARFQTIRLFLLQEIAGEMLGFYCTFSVHVALENLYQCVFA